jgi:hypothetical protein
MSRRNKGPRRSKGSKRSPTTRQIKIRDEALHALSLMRTKNMSLAEAARETRHAPRTLIKHVGKALTKATNGRYKANPSDRFVRRLHFLTEKGPDAVTVRGSRLASKIGSYMNAVERYLATGKTDELDKYAGKSVTVGKSKYPFVTDTQLIRRLYDAGAISFEDLYVH